MLKNHQIIRILGTTVVLLLHQTTANELLKKQKNDIF